MAWRMLAGGTQKQILLVDRDAAVVEPLRRKLEDSGFMVRVISDGYAAVAELQERPPHLVVIDWSLPGFGAYEAIELVRNGRLALPVRLIILSARSEERDVVAGLNLGADDYIAKPFSAREAAARICAVLRTHRTATPAVPVKPRGAEYRLLDFLMSHPGRTFSRAQLLAHVWADDDDIDPRTVDVNVQRLRKILAAPGVEGCIQTVRGFGYRFVNSSATEN
jgi:two-component system, OmpR family, phosphate regulon response regulator PhoB